MYSNLNILFILLRQAIRTSINIITFGLIRCFRIIDIQIFSIDSYLIILFIYKINNSSSSSYSSYKLISIYFSYYIILTLNIITFITQSSLDIVIMWGGFRRVLENGGYVSGYRRYYGVDDESQKSIEINGKSKKM